MEEKRYYEKIEVSEPAEKLARMFINKGFKIYLVGGGVRDYYLGRDSADHDFLTEANTEDMIGVLKENGISYDDTFICHHFVKANVDGEIIDLLSVDLRGGFEQDLRRRDLTINALAYDMEEGCVIDILGGVEDIRNKILRYANPEPNKREFMITLRAIRFCLELGFRIDPDTYRLMKENVDCFSEVIAVAMLHEMPKILKYGEKYFEKNE